VLVRALDRAALAGALEGAGIASTVTADGALLASADLSVVGAAAARAGIPLLELRQATDGRLEDLFLSLTTDAPVEVSR
jgi:ABC-2 type transport system ATP-binding protein